MGGIVQEGVGGQLRYPGRGRGWAVGVRSDATQDAWRTDRPTVHESVCDFFQGCFWPFLSRLETAHPACKCIKPH